jgi:peptidoglycan/xylan/chitin deacetylase (PgdA/CDA1 family)
VNELIDSSEALRKAVLRIAGATGLAPLAKPFLGGVGAILMLHSVTARTDPADGFNAHLTITPQFLDKLIWSMKADGYSFVSMDEAVARLRDRAGGDRFAAITLDDGYRDNMTEALPVFERHGSPFTIYIAPGMIDGTVDLWWEIVADVVRSRDLIYLTTPGGRVTLDCSTAARKVASLKKLCEYLTVDVSEADQQRVVREIADAARVDIERLRRGRLLDWDEVRTLSTHPLATIAAHTVSHRNLARLGEAEARREIRDAARIIESEIGVRPAHMAYPYGFAAAVGRREVDLAKEAGFVSAVTTRHGLLRRGHEHHLQALPRISVNGRYQQLGHLRTMLSGITTPLANAGKVLVTV